jgi:hypothetical protein
MTISKMDQIEKHYRWVTKHRPWLIPVTWRTPTFFASVEDAQRHNARLKDSYRQRMRRATTRAHAIVEATTELVGGPFSPTPVSRGTPKVVTSDLPRGWRSRELRGNRRAVSSSESMRKLETSNQRARLRVTSW